MGMATYLYGQQAAHSGGTGDDRVPASSYTAVSPKPGPQASTAGFYNVKGGF